MTYQASDERAERRVMILKGNGPRVDEAYRLAANDGTLEPVVFLIDVRDTVACQLAAQVAGPEAVDHAIAEVGQSGLVPLFAFAMSKEDARRVLEQFSMEGEAFLGRVLPENGCRVVVMAEGGSLFATHPVGGG